MKVKSISLLIILTLIFQLILPVLVPLVSYAEETQNRWDISEKGDGSVIAVLDSAGTLTISGKGNMINWYNSEKVSWYSKREDIKMVKIENGVTSIGILAFYGCRSLESIEIPNSVTTIGEYAFEYCRSLESIEIPNSVTTIGELAFEYCSSLISIEIPSSVISIGDDIFGYCNKLTNIDVDENNQSYLSENGVLFNKQKTKLMCYPAEKVETTYSIPSSVTSIGNGAFRNCSSLTSIEIPSSVRIIGYYTFFGCSNLININIPSSVTTIRRLAFGYCNKLTNIDVDENSQSYLSENGVLFNKQKTKLMCYPAEKVETTYSIPSSVTSIEEYAFHYCRSLESIEIPSSVTSIGEYAFFNCSSLISIEIPSSVTSIGAYSAFYGCSSSFKIYTNSDYVVSCAKENSLNYVIDKNSPTVASITVNPNTWTKGNVTVTINGATDEIVGLANKPYSFDGGVTWQVENTKTYTENTQGIQIQVRDSLGNVYKHKEINVQIDKTAPILEVTGNVTNWTKNNVTLTIKAKDEISGLKEVTVNGTKVNITNGQGTYTVNANGTYTIIAKDKVDNTTTKTIEVNKIDKTAPILEVTGNVTNWTKNNVTLTIKAKDEISGLKEVTVNGTKVNITNGQATYTVNANGIYTIIAKDKVDNTTTKTVAVDKIDKAAPTLEVTGNATNWTKNNVTLTIKAKDEISGLKEVTVNGTKVNITNGQGTYTVNANGTYTIIAKDNADNTTTKTIIVNKIDKTAPKITGVEEGKTYEVALTVTITDNSLKTVELTKDGVKVEGFKSGDTIRESGKYKLTATDEAGNISVVNFTMDIVLHVNTKYATEAIDGKYYITKVNPGTTIETFKNNISTNGTIKIYKGTTEITDTSKKISTGMTMKVQLDNKEVIYEIIVTGDLNGDGEMNDIDLLRLVRHKSGLDKTLTGSYLKASDICKDGTPSEDRDLLKMVRVLVGLDKI